MINPLPEEKITIHGITRNSGKNRYDIVKQIRQGGKTLSVEPTGEWFKSQEKAERYVLALNREERDRLWKKLDRKPLRKDLPKP